MLKLIALLAFVAACSALPDDTWAGTPLDSKGIPVEKAVENENPVTYRFACRSCKICFLRKYIPRCGRPCCLIGFRCRVHFCGRTASFGGDKKMAEEESDVQLENGEKNFKCFYCRICLRSCRACGRTCCCRGSGRCRCISCRRQGPPFFVDRN